MDRRFYRARDNLGVVLQEFSKEIPRLIQREALVENIGARLCEVLDLPTLGVFVRQDSDASDRWTLAGQVRYEGEDEAVRQLFVDACRDARMGELYCKNLTQFREVGGTIFDAWGWIASNGMWSNVENVRDRSHPKYRALADFARESPCWWEGCDRSRR